MTTITINDIDHTFDTDEGMPLLWVIRDILGMTGTKFGCGIGQCGACTVLVDGQPTRSCITPLESVEGQAIVTIEAIEEDAVGRSVVEAWVAHQVPQCGYCQSGQVMAATALLKQNATPGDEDVINAMTNLCRCGTYNAVTAAVRQAAKGGRTKP